MTGYSEDAASHFAPLPLAPDMPLELAHALLSEVPMRVVVVDETFRYVFANRAALKRMGKSLQAVVGRPFSEVRGPKATAALEAGLNDLRAGRTLHWEGINEFPGASTQYTEAWLHPLLRADGSLLILIYAHDLTELKAQQQLLQDQLDTVRRVEHLKTVIVDNALAAFVSTDADGRVVEFNPAAEAMFGCTRDEAIGQMVETIMIPPEQRAAHQAGLQRMRAGHSPRILGKRMELTAQRPDGTRFPVEMVLWQTDLQGRPHFTASLIDLSERKRAAETIERQRDALRHAERMGAMGSMLAGVAHELNNPLAIVMGRATLLGEKAAGTELEDDVRRILEAAERCGRIVRTFLDMARSRPTERKAVVLNELVQGGVELLRYGLRTHGVQLKLELGDKLPTPIANPDQIGQIVLNLIVNAQQVLAGCPEPREICVSTGMLPGQQGLSPLVWLRVSDNGPGVADNQRDAIFEPFFTTKPEGQGLGLGLALCRSIAREHGGDLQLENTPRGASFRLSLPIDGQLQPRAAEHELEPGSFGDPRHVLVVDDEEEIAELMRQFLESAGYDVAVAESGSIALEMLAEVTFDVVVSDLRMPDMDGSALWREVSEKWPHLSQRLLFVTGDSLSQGAAEFFEQAACPTLIKPFTKSELLSAIQRLLSAA